MIITINMPRRVVYLAGAAHHLSRVGCNRLLAWLQDYGRLRWGWTGKEYVFFVEVR